MQPDLWFLVVGGNPSFQSQAGEVLREEFSEAKITQTKDLESIAFSKSTSKPDFILLDLPKERQEQDDFLSIASIVYGDCPILVLADPFQVGAAKRLAETSNCVIALKNPNGWSLIRAHLHSAIQSRQFLAELKDQAGDSRESSAPGGTANLPLERRFLPMNRKERQVREFSEAVALLAEDGKCMYASPSIEQTLGYWADECVGRDPLEIVVSDDRQKSKQSAKEVRETPGSRMLSVHRICDKKGTIRRIECSCVNRLDDPNLRAVVMVIRGMADIQSDKDELLAAEDRFRRLMETLPVGILFEFGGEIVYANERMMQIIGTRNPRDIFGRQILDLVHPESREKMANGLRSLHEGAESNPPEVQRILRRDGSHVDVEVLSSSFQDRGRRAVQMVVQEMNDRNQVLERLTFQAKLLDSVHDAITALDLDFKILTWNRGAQELYGWTFEEVLGRDAFDVCRSLVPEVVQRELMRHLLKTGRFMVRGTHHHKDGTPIQVDVTMTALRDQAGHVSGYLRTIRNVTEQVRAEEETQASLEGIRNLANRLQAIREEERTLIAREIHDELGQALTALNMDLAWIQRRIGKSQTDLHEKLHSSTQLVDSTIQTVRRLATELRPGILDELGLIPAITWYAQEFQKRSRIKCALSLPPVDLTFPPGVSTGVFRIFQEALTNVVRHARAKNIHVVVRSGEALIHMEVADDGVGMKDSDKASPAALGLLGMQERALALGGNLQFEGTEKGTTVRLSIPFAQAV